MPVVCVLHTTKARADRKAYYARAPQMPKVRALRLLCRHTPRTALASDSVLRRTPMSKRLENVP